MTEAKFEGDKHLAWAEFAIRHRELYVEVPHFSGSACTVRPFVGTRKPNLP